MELRQNLDIKSDADDTDNAVSDKGSDDEKKLGKSLNCVYKKDNLRTSLEAHVSDLDNDLDNKS